MSEDSFMTLLTALLFILMVLGLLFGGTSYDDLAIPLYVLFPS